LLAENSQNSRLKNDIQTKNEIFFLKNSTLTLAC
jgi:hypothetical protein